MCITSWRARVVHVCMCACVCVSCDVITVQSIKALTRTLLEEAGLDCPAEIGVRRCLVGASFHPDRDIRYAVNLSRTGVPHGYKRDSIAYVAVAVIPRLETKMTADGMGPEPQVLLTVCGGDCSQSL